MQMPVKSNSFTPSPSPSPTRKSFMRSVPSLLYMFFYLCVSNLKTIYLGWCRHNLGGGGQSYAYLSSRNNVFKVISEFFMQGFFFLLQITNQWYCFLYNRSLSPIAVRPSPVGKRKRKSSRNCTLHNEFLHTFNINVVSNWPDADKLW